MALAWQSVNASKRGDFVEDESGLTVKQDASQRHHQV